MANKFGINQHTKCCNCRWYAYGNCYMQNGNNGQPYAPMEKDGWCPDWGTRKGNENTISEMLKRLKNHDGK